MSRWIPKDILKKRMQLNRSRGGIYAKNNYRMAKAYYKTTGRKKKSSGINVKDYVFDKINQEGKKKW
jgi:hypothetical protein